MKPILSLKALPRKKLKLTDLNNICGTTCVILRERVRERLR